MASPLQFAEDDFMIHIEDLEIGPKIGEGQFSTVCLGRYIVKKQTRNTKAMERYLERELAALKNLQHENLMEFYGAANIQEALTTSSKHPYSVYIVTEFAEGGDLLNLLMHKEVPLGWKLRMRIMRDAAAGLHYMHSKGLIHRDIKSSNFLLDRRWRCKISDFGMARDLTNQRMTICGTDEYMAPEIMLDEPYSTPVDIFSYGVVLLEVLARKKAGEDKFAHRPVTSYFRLDMDKVRAQLPPNCPPSLVELAVQSAAYEVEDRPDAEAILGWIDDLCASWPEDECPEPPLPNFPDFPLPDLKGMAVTRHVAEPFKEDKAEVRAAAADDLPSSMQSISNSLTLPSGADTGVGHKGGDEETRVPYMEGYLHKRKIVGFRIWKRRYVVLQGSELTWHDRPHGEMRGHLLLRGHSQVVKDRRSFKWAILDSAHQSREFAATSLALMQQWMAAIDAAIERANANASALSDDLPPPALFGAHTRRTGALSPPLSTTARGSTLGSNSARSSTNPTNTSAPPSRGISLSGSHASHSLGAASPPPSPPAPLAPLRWDPRDVPALLASICLSDLLPRFQEKGYMDLPRLLELGLSDDDFVRLGIDSPITRRLLGLALEADFNEGIHIEVLGCVQLGDTICYKVRSRWRMTRSTVYLSTDDLKTLHAELSAPMASSSVTGPSPHSEEAVLHHGAIPALPPRHERAAMLFKSEHRKLMPTKDQLLEDWFRCLVETFTSRAGPSAEAVRNQGLLLAVLDLLPRK